MASITSPDEDYTYETSGIDRFFTRQQELGSTIDEEAAAAPGGLAELNFDSIQTGGSLGSVLRIGERFTLDGVNGALELKDSEGRVVIQISSEES